MGSIQKEDWVAEMKRIQSANNSVTVDKIVDYMEQVEQLEQKHQAAIFEVIKERGELFEELTQDKQPAE